MKYAIETKEHGSRWVRQEDNLTREDAASSCAEWIAAGWIVRVRELDNERES